MLFIILAASIFSSYLTTTLPPSLPSSTDGLTSPTQSALIPQPVGSAPRLGSMSTTSRIVVEWDPAPPLPFSSPIVYRLEYSLVHMDGSRMPTQVATVSNSFLSSPHGDLSRSAALLSESSSHNECKSVRPHGPFILRHLPPFMVVIQRPTWYNFRFLAHGQWSQNCLEGITLHCNVKKTTIEVFLSLWA